MMWRNPLEDMSMEEDNLRNIVAGSLDSGRRNLSASTGSAIAHLTFDTPGSTMTRSRSAAIYSTYLSTSAPAVDPQSEQLTSTPSMNTRLQTSAREHGFDSMAMTALLTPPETPGHTLTHTALSLQKRHYGSPDKLLRSREMLLHASPVKKRLLMNRTASRTEVTNQIKALSHDQAIELLLNLYQSSLSPLTQQMEMIMPRPDLRPALQKLNTLQKNVYRSIPSATTFRLGSSSNRDAACFRVTRHNLAEFKNACLDQAQQLVNLEQYDLVIDYVLKAWKYVDDLPDWDNPSHNLYKQQCFRGLCKHCQTALSHLSIESQQQYTRLVEKLTWANDLSAEMKPCLRMLERHQQDSPTSLSPPVVTLGAVPGSGSAAGGGYGSGCGEDVGVAGAVSAVSEQV